MFRRARRLAGTHPPAPSLQGGGGAALDKSQRGSCLQTLRARVASGPRERGATPSLQGGGRGVGRTSARPGRSRETAGHVAAGTLALAASIRACRSGPIFLFPLHFGAFEQDT